MHHNSLLCQKYYIPRRESVKGSLSRSVSTRSSSFTNRANANAPFAWLRQMKTCLHKRINCTVVVLLGHPKAREANKKMFSKYAQIIPSPRHKGARLAMRASSCC